MAFIQEIKLQTIYAPLREPRNPRNPCFRKNGSIWSVNNRDTVPFTVALKHPSNLFIHVAFQGDIRHNLRGKTVQLTGYTESIGNVVKFLSDRVTLGGKAVEDTGTQYVEAIPVSIHGYSSEVPWGMSCDVSWELVLDGDKSVLSIPTKLTIYALTDDLPKYLHNEGIPIQFLEMMVQPTIKKNIKEKKKWIEFVVWRCFASRFDEYLKNSKDEELQSRYKEAIHSYRYNSFLSGKPNFTSGTEGGTLDLDRWLLNCNPPGKDQWYGTNCYDMSALVQTALRLGLPYHYKNQNGETVKDKNNEDDGKLLTVSRAFRSPFGYIKPLDLVGWGMSNSPFFENEKLKMLEKEKELVREGFGNHAWVRVRISDTDPNEECALDACAGPVAKPPLMSEYLTTAVDNEATKANIKNELRFRNFDPKKEPNEKVGVRSIIWNKPAERWQKTTFMGSSALRLRCIGVIDGNENPELLIGNGGPGNGMTAVENVIGHDVQPIPVPMEDLLSTAFIAAVESLDAAAPANADIHINGSTTFVYGPFTVRTPEPSVTSDGTIIHFDIWTANSGAPFLSITTTVLTDCKQALEYLVTHLNMITHDMDTVWDIPEKDFKDGKILILPKEDPAVRIGAVIRSNVLVTMCGSAEKSIMDKVLNAMAEFMDPFFGKVVEKVDISQVTWKLDQSELIKGEAFSLIITAPKAVDISLMSTTKAIYIEQSPADQVNSDDWIVDCFAVDCKDYDKSAKTLIAAFAAKGTYYTTTQEFDLED